MTDDPFACFDDENDGEDNDDNDNNDDVDVDPDTHARQRDPECGVLAFHHGTERALLLYVQQYCKRTATYNAEVVRQAVDTFCLERHWMMHVGPEKSRQLESFLTQCCIARKNASPIKTAPFQILELGTYCGYSAIAWAETLQKQQPHLGVNNFHVYTVEANPDFIVIARELIRLAGLESFISVLHFNVSDQDKSTILQLLHENAVSHVDFLFLDHDKQSYLQDLQALENAFFIRAGVHVVADNVVFARIDNYRRYMQHLAQKGIVETRMEQGYVEYSEMEQNTATDPRVYEDGIGKSVCVFHKYEMSGEFENVVSRDGSVAVSHALIQYRVHNLRP